MTIVRDLLANPDIQTLRVDGRHVEGALDLFRQLDKTYSLCDAVSFLLMRERGETEALTTDRHFEQEVFVRLLKS